MRQSASGSGAQTFTRSDTFTGVANGVTVASSEYVKSFSIQATGTGAIPTTWNIRLEGSTDNVNFTTMLTHTNVTGNGILLFSGATLFPVLYFRSRVNSLNLGAATNIVVKILGTT
jgi:hypothetical protein